MNKVFCHTCKWFELNVVRKDADYSGTGYTCTKEETIHKDEDTPIYPGSTYRSFDILCYDKNKNNDCVEYEEKTYPKKLKWYQSFWQFITFHSPNAGTGMR